MIPLKCILEYAIVQGQSYDFGNDFRNFQKTLDGTTEQVKEKFEKTINSQLQGKRIRARASRGYKQFEKDYEFEVSRITIDDYYDNFVVVAHDESNDKKAKEYFLKPGSKIQIIGPGTSTPASHADMNKKHGQLPDVSKQTPQKAVPTQVSPQVIKPNSQLPVREDKDVYEAYSIDEIEKDISPWMKLFIKNHNVDIREFIKKLGWQKPSKNGSKIAVYELTIPKEMSRSINEKTINSVLEKVNNSNKKGEKLLPIKFDDKDDVSYKIRIKKILKNSTPSNQSEKH